NQQGYFTALDAQAYAVAVLDIGQRPAYGRFRRHVQDDGAESGAAHAAVRNPDDVLDPFYRQLPGDGNIARLGHAGSALGADILQDQEIVGIDVEILAVDPLRHVGRVLEHHGPALVLHQARVGGRLLDDGPARGQIAFQHRYAA